MKNFFSLMLLNTIFLSAAIVGCTGRSRNVQTASSSTPLELVNDRYGVAHKINPNEKYVYLIFTGHHSQDDDGYFENFDGAGFVVDVLNKHNIKGSFFPTGVCFEVDKYKPVLRKIIADGHYLSGHSYAHLLLCSYEDRNENLVTFDSIAQDNVKMEQLLQEFGLTKEQYIWMVPPYEHYNQFSADAYRQLGYKLANPTERLVTHLDWMGTDHPSYHSAERLINNIWEFEKDHTLNGAIILIHAMNYPVRTPEDRPYMYLDEIITHIQELGYGFKSFWDVIEQEKNTN
jgi:peptidoglycan/xylan/chitin deacetylase (PgdA/CDA1 family)